MHGDPVLERDDCRLVARIVADIHGQERSTQSLDGASNDGPFARYEARQYVPGLLTGQHVHVDSLACENVAKKLAGPPLGGLRRASDVNRERQPLVFDVDAGHGAKDRCETVARARQRDRRLARQGATGTALPTMQTPVLQARQSDIGSENVASCPEYFRTSRFIRIAASSPSMSSRS